MEKVKISAIKANSKNPRVIKDDKFKKLVKSIQDFPEMLEKRPLVCFTDIDGKYVVLGGNMRLKAAQEVGLKELPIVLANDWTQEQRDEFLIKDNVGFGEWDWDQLANEWDAGKLDEWGLDVPNFDGEVLEAEEDDFDTTLPDEPITVLGDLYEIGEHRLLCGDSTDSDQVEKLMNGQKADMVFTDPPYRVSFQGQRISNTTKDGVVIHGHKGANTKHNEIENDSLSEDDFKDFMSGVLSNLFMFNKGAWYICFAYSELHLLLNSLVDAGYKWKNIIIWMKNQAALSNMDYKSRYEPIIYGQPGSCFYGERYKQEDIWEFQRTLKNDLHPTMKPIPLIENALKNSSKVGMSVLDLFLGSGSTMVASQQLKRKCYGMELDPKYCDVIVNRMIALDPNIEIKLNGKPFEKAH
jgi:site-specific DNA-methyltransferase (adenine-specific)